MHEFRLQDTSAALVSASPNKEKHGEEWIDRVDLKLTKQGSKELLGKLVKNPDGLMKCLWDKDGTRLPGVRRLSFDRDCHDHYVVVRPDYDDAVVLTEAKINKFTADIDDMGICDVTFRVQAYPGAPADIGTLAHLQQEVVRLTILPQEAVEAAGDDDGQSDIGDGTQDDAA